MLVSRPINPLWTEPVQPQTGGDARQLRMRWASLLKNLMSTASIQLTAAQLRFKRSFDQRVRPARDEPEESVATELHAPGRRPRPQACSCRGWPVQGVKLPCSSRPNVKERPSSQINLQRCSESATKEEHTENPLTEKHSSSSLRARKQPSEGHAAEGRPHEAHGGASSTGGCELWAQAGKSVHREAKHQPVAGRLYHLTE